jgi:hypothetical protein
MLRIIKQSACRDSSHKTPLFEAERMLADTRGVSRAIDAVYSVGHGPAGLVLIGRPAGHSAQSHILPRLTSSPP